MKPLSIFLFLTIFSAGTIRAQQSVALVLSGGGAKGFAHIGVLKALEENHIPIDYIVGNSMGALVGAMYAAGYSPDEIKSVLVNHDLYEFKRGNDKKDHYFFQSNGPDASWVSVPFTIDKGLQPHLPFHLYNIQDFDYLMMQLFAKASQKANYRFDSLMVPFRCIATDIDSSNLVVLSKGDLAESVRASLTFPFFIRPIRVNDKLLFDGGMLDNFPVKLAIDTFQPDFVIGSQAVKNFSPPSADDVVSQLQNMLMRKANFSIDSVSGIIIETKTGSENVFQFQKVEQYIDSGYRAALRAMPGLKKYIGQFRPAEVVKEKRNRFRDNSGDLLIGDVLIEGVNPKQKKYFLKSIKWKKEGFNSRTFQKEYRKLLANENVVSIYPSLCFNADSNKYDLTLNIKPADPFNLKFGGFISSSAVNQAYVSFGYHRLGRMSKYVTLSTNFGTFYNSFYAQLKLEHPGQVPFSLNLDFLVSRKNYFASARYFFEDQNPAYIVIDENYLDFNIGIPVGLSHSLRVGVSNLNINYLYQQDNTFTRTDTADQSNFYFVNPYIEFERNSLNRKQFATKGSRFFLGFNYYTGNEHIIPGSTSSGQQEERVDRNFFLLSTHYEHYLQLFKPFILGLQADFGYSNKPLLTNYVSSLLIASPFEPVILMQNNFLENYRSYSYGAIGVKTIFNLYKHLDLRLEGYAYLPYQKIVSDSDYQATYGKTFSYIYYVGNANLVYNTAIGPIGLAVNYFEKDGDKISFLLSIGWNIYNKSRFYK